MVLNGCTLRAATTALVAWLQTAALGAPTHVSFPLECAAEVRQLLVGGEVCWRLALVPWVSKSQRR